MNLKSRDHSIASRLKYGGINIVQRLSHPGEIHCADWWITGKGDLGDNQKFY